MNLAKEERVQYYRDLNLPGAPQPTLKQIRSAYQEIRLMHQARANSPVTPGDYHSRDILRKATIAYQRLCNSGADHRNPSIKYYRLTVRELLALYYDNPHDPHFEIMTSHTRACKCKKICDTCAAEVMEGDCRRCHGRGWINYCDSCNATGVLRSFEVVRYPLGKLSQDYLWMSDPYSVHLRISPGSDSLGIHEDTLCYDHIIILQDLLGNGLKLPPLEVELSPGRILRIPLNNFRNLTGTMNIPLEPPLQLPGVDHLRLTLIPMRKGVNLHEQSS